MNVPSYILRLVLNAFGAGHPMRLCVGVGAGYFVKLIFGAWRASNPNPSIEYLASVDPIIYCLISASIFFMPIVFGNKVAESASHQIRLVRALIDQTNLSKTQETLMWRALLDKYINSVKPDLSGGGSLEVLAKDLPDDLAGTGS